MTTSNFTGSQLRLRNLEFAACGNYDARRNQIDHDPHGIREAASMPKVHFVREKKTIEVPDGANLRTEARRNGIQLYWGPHKVFNCLGLGVCTTCKVLIRKGVENVSPQTTWERLNLLKPPALFARIGHEDDLRLSCQTTVHGDIEVETQPEMNWHGERFWA